MSGLMNRMPATAPVRVSSGALRALRAALLDKLRDRLAVVTGPDSEYRFRDPNFVRELGPGLDRLSDRWLVDLAVAGLTVAVRDAPPGTCGIEWIDNITPGGDDLSDD